MRFSVFSLLRCSSSIEIICNGSNSNTIGKGSDQNSERSRSNTKLTEWKSKICPSITFETEIMNQQHAKKSFMSSFVLKNKKRFNDDDDENKLNDRLSCMRMI